MQTDCSRCKKTDLSWDEQHFDNTGKWRLFDHNLERPHQCPTEKIKAPEEKNQYKITEFIPKYSDQSNIQFIQVMKQWRDLEK